MSNHNESQVSRRAFVQRTGVLAGGMLLGATGATASGATGRSELPRRVLGKTNVPISALSIGTAPMGFSKHVSVRQVADIINTALDEGVNTIDTARHYGKAEEGVGLALGRRRKDVFLTTKIWADTIEDAEKSLAKSFELLKTDYIDLLYFHSLGNRKVDVAMDPDGVFTWMVKQKKAGKAKFLGLSGHHLPKRFLPFIESDEVDVVLMLMNFADRYTYNFEETVLPVARKHNVGVIAMKVLAGPRGGFSAYGGPKSPPQIDEKYVELAIRYALGLPGVAAVNLGVHDPQQVRTNVQIVKNFRPLSAEEQARLEKVGRQLAVEWGPHFGPLNEEDVVQ